MVAADRCLSCEKGRKCRWWLSPVARDRPETRQEWEMPRKVFCFYPFPIVAPLRKNTQVQVDEPEIMDIFHTRPPAPLPYLCLMEG
jgi:hypothetical protein